MLNNKQEKRNLLSKEVSKKIQDLIIKHELKPNDRLPSEGELCEIMAVSRSTIREAIKELVSNNVVYIKRGKGTFISENPGLIRDPLGVNFINDDNLIMSLFEARILIEPQVAKLAAKRADEEEIEILEKSVLEMEHSIESGNFEMNQDLEFHIALAKATKNKIIQRIVPIINESIIEGFTQTVNVEGSQTKAIKSHKEILEAIKNHNPEKAEEMMKKHLKGTVKDIEEKSTK